MADESELPFFPEMEFLARCPTGTYVRALRRLDRTKKIFPKQVFERPFAVGWDNQYRMAMAQPGMTMMAATLQNVAPSTPLMPPPPPAEAANTFIKRLVNGEWMETEANRSSQHMSKSFIRQNKLLLHRLSEQKKLANLAASGGSEHNGSRNPTKRPLQGAAGSSASSSPAGNSKKGGLNRARSSTPTSGMRAVGTTSPASTFRPSTGSLVVLKQANAISANLRAFRDMFRSFDPQHSGCITLGDFELLGQVVNFGIPDYEIMEIARRSIEGGGGGAGSSTSLGSSTRNHSVLRYTTFLRELQHLLVEYVRQGRLLSFTAAGSKKSRNLTSSGGVAGLNDTNQTFDEAATMDSAGGDDGGEEGIWREWDGVRRFFGQHGRVLQACLKAIDKSGSGFVPKGELMRAVVGLEGSVALPLPLLSQIADVCVNESRERSQPNGTASVEYVAFLNACVAAEPPPVELWLQHQQQHGAAQGNRPSTSQSLQFNDAVAAIDRITQRASSRPGTSASRPGTSSSTVFRPDSRGGGTFLRPISSSGKVQQPRRPSTSMSVQRMIAEEGDEDENEDSAAHTQQVESVLANATAVANARKRAAKGTWKLEMTLAPNDMTSGADLMRQMDRGGLRAKTPAEIRSQLRSSQTRKPLVDAPSAAEQAEWHDTRHTTTALASSYALRDRQTVLHQPPARLSAVDQDKLMTLLAALKAKDSVGLGRVPRDYVISMLGKTGFHLPLMELKGLLHESEIWADGLVDILVFEELLRDHLANRAVSHE